MSDSTLEYNQLFNAEDSDLTIQSCDGQLFRVHQRNLHDWSDAFPGSEMPLQPKDIVCLSESAKTLELLFQFMYRQPQPDVQNLAIDQIASLAEAVEKYGVFTAQQVCRLVMCIKIPDSPLTVLRYALKHHHPELIKSAAAHAYAKGCSHTSVLNALGEEHIDRWDNYCSNIRDTCRHVASQPPPAEPFRHKGGRKRCEYWKIFSMKVTSSIERHCLSKEEDFEATFAHLELCLEECKWCLLRGEQWRHDIYNRGQYVQAISF
ncbi:hypothetical protein C8Q72DRAFT_857551 [Fomitopsis betulina]|nr:hypothetical protein C8Q72DRAFT_857551 [Fomitopsis betulina]